MDKFTGGCLCGQLRIVAIGQPYRVGICHCLDCRKHHGALVHASAGFPHEAVTVPGGAPSRRSRISVAYGPVAHIRSGLTVGSSG